MSDSDLNFDDSDEPQMECFVKAAEHIQRIHATLTSDTLLELYALYKQGTVGRCNTKRPGIFQMAARAKWDAWQQLNDMSSAEAQNLYVKKVAEIDPKWQNAQNKTFGNTMSSWVVHSIQQQPTDPDDCKAEEEKTASDYIKELNVVRFKEVFEPHQLHALDAHGMALIHWATDRNSIEILEYLIAAGADVNQRDVDQQTPLHYAASCGHVDALLLLLQNNADQTLYDSDGQTCHDVADNEEIRCILNSTK